MARQGCRLPLRLLLLVVVCAGGAMTATDFNYYDPSGLFGCNSEGIYFVSDRYSNQVQVFGAQSGTLIGGALPANSSYNSSNPLLEGYPLGQSTTAVSGPYGVVIYDEVLFLVNGNDDVSASGSVLAFAVPEGVKDGKLEASQLPFRRLFPDPIDENAAFAPYAPSGLVIGGNGPAMFVADTGGPDVGGQIIVVDASPPYVFKGLVSTAGIPAAYDFTNASLIIGPQGLVIGPEDGLLYVTIRSFAGLPANFGAILRFDISTLPGTFKDIFATTEGATDCSQFLHRPEGITWGPAKGLYKDRLLYVTANTDSLASTPPVNTADPGASDKIVIFNSAGQCVDYIILEPKEVLVQGLRTTTSGPVFGPKGDLYVPVSANINAMPLPNNFTGGYRKYTVPNSNPLNKAAIVNHTLAFDTIVPPNLAGPLGVPTFSVFGRSDPSTLEYQCLV